jgi:hypothetical protein
VRCSFRFEKKDTTHERAESGGEAMKTKTAKVLPKTTQDIQNGGLYLQRVRCGKANCKCARGEVHSAYYFFTRRNGKLIKQYVRKAEVEAFSEIVNQSKALKAQKRTSAKQSNELLKRLRVSVREYEQITKLYKEIYNNE